MKKNVCFIFTLFIVIRISAQGVGIDLPTGTDPRATLDVNGNAKFNPDSIKNIKNQPNFPLALDASGYLIKDTANSQKFDLMSICYNGGFGGTNRVIPLQTYSDERSILVTLGATPAFYFQKEGTYSRRTDFLVGNLDDGIQSVALLNGFLYVLGRTTSGIYKVYRFNANDITQNPVQMTFTGKNLGTSASGYIMMTVDKGNFFFSFDAGNNTNDNRIAKYSLSGTSFIYSSTTTVGSTGNMIRFFVINDDYYGFAFNSDSKIRKFNSSGTQIYTGADFIGSVSSNRMFQLDKNIFIADNVSLCLYRIFY